MNNWKKINGFNDRYSVNTKGVIRNDERSSTVKPMLSTSGYHYVHLVINRKKYTRYVHRLVGEAFIENPMKHPQIDHIDGCKTNNDLSNLRWVNVSTNCLAYGSKQRAKNRKKSIIARNINGDELVFDSRQALAKYFNCSPSKVKYNYLYSKSSKKGWIFEKT